MVKARAVITVLSGASAVALLAGCGGPSPLVFKATPQLLRLRVGDRVTVQKSAGECGSPFSTDPRVIVAQNPTRQGDCSPAGIVFKAVGPGSASILGQLPCHHTECMAESARIGVIVRRR